MSAQSTIRASRSSATPSRETAGAVRQVVLLTTDFPPRVGGIAEYHAGLVREASRWATTTVYSTVLGSDGAFPGAHHLAMPPERRLGERIGDRVGFLRRVNTFAHFAALRRYARREVASIVRGLASDSRLCVGLWSPLAHFWCEALMAAGRRYAIFAHGLDVIEPLYPTIAPWRATDFRRAARVIGCSFGTVQLAQERLGLDRARLRVVNPGIDVASFSPPAPDRVRAIRAELALPAGCVALSVGRLVRRKGFHVALRAFAAYHARRGDATYLVAGDGPERAALVSLAAELGVADRVRFLGAVDESTKLALYEIADVFVMPNSVLDNRDWEGFGIVFLEAARAGKPAIGGANGGVPDAVVDGVTGILVDPSDQQAVDRALATLLSDVELRARLGTAARRRAAESFEWSVIGDRFRAVLEEAW